MGKRGYNWKGRQVVHTVIDNTETKKIHLDLNVAGTYDQSNELVLPSKKRKTKTKDQKLQVTRILTKKQRKKFEKVVEKKKKKENRASLLEALSKVQATPEELNGLTSIAAIQTKGLKKYFQEQQAPEKAAAKSKSNGTVGGEKKINSLAGSKRKRLALLSEGTTKNNDPNIVGFESSGSESDSESDHNDSKAKNDNESNEEVANKKLKLADEDCASVSEENATETPSKEALIDDSQKSNKNGQKNPVAIENVGTKQLDSNKTVEKKPAIVDRKPAVFVQLDRKSAIQKARLKLPILAEEQQIMEKINENPVLILAGETGSGKTTQVPQFLYEAGYALKKMIGVTEPRRVAAISMSKRVAEEMNLTSKEVSYLIRFEGNATDATKIKFMTDGVLLKEVHTDFLLSKYSVIILDEAHERSVYTDILIGLLSRIVPLRIKRGDPLKLIVMSATLRLEDFTENKRLFKVTPPVLKVEARQFPVTVHFNKRTNENYMKDAYNKAVKIHTKLPDGGILIFVTGQQEVNTLIRKLRRAFPLKQKNVPGGEQRNGSDDSNSDSDLEVEDGLKRVLKHKRSAKVVPQIDLDDYSVPGDNEELNSEDELDMDSDDDVSAVSVFNAKPLWVLPLYSLLPGHKQAEVFKAPPPDCRLCVVSTNVAETSLTIPNVKYVVDSGKTKVKLYDKTTGVTSYMVTWTSKASANQRAGRAGRLGPGHCYRLYSSAVFNDTFQEFSVPEIQQKPVDDLYLQMKCMNIDKVVNFPFPTAPDLLQLKTAEGRLQILGALSDSKVTALGRAISKFPVLPRFGKMLALSHQQNLLPYTICIVAALSVQEVLLETPILQSSADEVRNIRQKWAAIRRQWAGIGNSLLLGDPMVLLRAVGAAEYANSEGKLEQFCAENGLRQKAVTEIRKLRIQLTNEIKTNVPNSNVVVDPKLSPPTDLQAKLLRQILLSGMGDQVAKKIMPSEVKEGEDKIKFKYAYRANNMEDPVFLHQGSVLKKTLPEFVVYQEIYETNKMYMRGVTAVEPDWLPIYVASACQLSEPLADPEPRFDPSNGKIYCTVSGTFGSQAWELSSVEVEFPKTMTAYKWFAKFLLEGKVFKKLEKYTGALLSQPNIMLKTWARLQPRTDFILKALISKQILTKGALEDAWAENPKYLLTEYLKWLPESAHTEASLFWPPLD